MTRDELETRSQQRGEAEQVAVGIVARAGATDAVVRTALRANQRGYPVVVTYPGGRRPAAIELLEQFDVEILEPLEPESDEQHLRDLLALTARARSFAGIIIQGDDYDWIDFESSEANVDEETFVVDAVTDAETSLPPSVGVLVGIPAYNEAGTIADVVARADDHADHVLVVDDGSTDDTVERAEAAGAHVLRHETNSGYGAALKTIFEEAHRRNVDRLVVLDADAQHDPEDVRQLLDEQERTGVDIVIGSRFLGSSRSELPVYRRVGLAVINAMTNLSLANLTPDSWIHDTQSGFRAYNGRTVGILAESDDVGNDMDASTDILHTAYRNDCDVREVETTIRYDVDNANSYNPVFHGLLLVSNLLQTVEREHPILLLGVPGFGLLSVGIFFGYLLVSNFVQTGTFPVGTAMAMLFFSIVGLFSCFTSLILHSLNVHLRNGI
ncbi:glycosyltransferase family 2 protein [Halorussus litoreus]|uniref:glycosyltransferase family 2 protein n=1 Tax=Halorussus litoreus TaxID=1710536 RepID=UPI000E24E536|nr:glycosyltransferase family 2 protein [Halorussus litoreus]